MPADTEPRADDVATGLKGLDGLELHIDPRPSLLSRVWASFWPKVMAIGIVVGLWELLVLSEWKPRYALAGPTDVWPELVDLSSTGAVQTALRITLVRIVGGFALALAIGLVLGIVLSASSVLRRGFGSIITGLQTMPSVAWFPLALLLFGVSEQAIQFVVVLGAAPSIANGVISGVDNVPPLYLRAGRVLGARGWRKWRHVVLPAIVPNFIGGMKQGWAFAWRSLLAGEIIVTVPGAASVGVLLQSGRDLSNSAFLLAVMIVILVIGIVVDTVFFGQIEKRVRHTYGLDLA